MTRKEKLFDDTHRVGLQVRTYSPGDGVTRYRFFEVTDEEQTYFGPANGIHTALGIKEAEQFVATVEHLKHIRARRVNNGA